MAYELAIRLFGGARIALDGVQLDQFMSSKAPALLAYLVISRRQHRR